MTMIEIPTNASALTSLAISCFNAGLEAASPEVAIEEAVSVTPETITIGEWQADRSAFDRMLILGAGKPAPKAISALATIFPEATGLVATPHRPNGLETGQVEIKQASHPIPDERGLEIANDQLQLAADADDSTLVLVVVGGGGSALLPAPAGDMSLDDLRVVTDDLLASGAAIDDINAVRKHLSRIKGGQLAAAAHPATVVGLVFSDVVGDDPATIASGPTAPDPTTYEDAMNTLETYLETPPAAVIDHLEAGLTGTLEETPTASDPGLEGVHNELVLTNENALVAMKKTAAEAGWNARMLSRTLTGEASELGRFHAAIATEATTSGDPIEPPAMLCSGGEATVTVTGTGDGGPNLECVLAGALELPENAVLGAIDSDGNDGSTTAAGAILDGQTIPDEQAAKEALESNDTLAYLTDIEALLESGPTGTNVNDLRLVLIPD